VSNRGTLWVAFTLVHIAVGVLGFVLPNEPMGDVYRVYEPWSSQALQGNGVVGITESWVYPQLALAPMLLAQPLGALLGSYTVAWALIVVAADAVAFAILVGTGRSAGRATAAWFWLVFIALLGPVGLYRLDGFTVAMAIPALLWLVGRPWLASLLLSAATWMKVWPAALLAAALVTVRRRGAIIGGAVALSAATVAAVVVAGGAEYVLGFVGDQTTRGLQVEAPVSTPYVWAAMLGIDGAGVYYDADLLTFQVTGAEVDVVIAVMTPLLLLCVGGAAVLGAVQAWRGAHFAVLFPPLALALVAGFVAVNKVGSPQYLCWFAPALVLALVLDRRRWIAPASVALAMALLTQLIYPVLYHGILQPQLVPVAILSVRNLALIAFFVWMTVRVARVPTRARRTAPASVP
jgi:hypothetical protein